MDITSHDWVIRKDYVTEDRPWSIYSVDTMGHEEFMERARGLRQAERRVKHFVNTSQERVRIESRHHDEECPAGDL